MDQPSHALSFQLITAELPSQTGQGVHGLEPGVHPEDRYNNPRADHASHQAPQHLLLGTKHTLSSHLEQLGNGNLRLTDQGDRSISQPNSQAHPQASDCSSTSCSL